LDVFTPGEVTNLKPIIEKLDRFASENRSLANKLGLKNKFAEAAGEGMRLIHCYQKFGGGVVFPQPYTI
jgi:hypothetical protein